MEKLNYTTKEINRDYIIKVSGIYNEQKINKAVGVKGFMEVVGDVALCNRLLDRVFACMEDKCVCKLRRGVKISFYLH